MVSQRELAEALGVSPATVSLWEAGERIPRADMAASYMEVLIYKTDNQRHGVVLMDQSSRDDTLVDIGPPGATPAGAVSSQSSRDKHHKRSAGRSSMGKEGRAISTYVDEREVLTERDAARSAETEAARRFRAAEAAIDRTRRGYYLDAEGRERRTSDQPTILGLLREAEVARDAAGDALLVARDRRRKAELAAGQALLADAVPAYEADAAQLERARQAAELAHARAIAATWELREVEKAEQQAAQPVIQAVREGLPPEAADEVRAETRYRLPVGLDDDGHITGWLDRPERDRGELADVASRLSRLTTAQAASEARSGHGRVARLTRLAPKQRERKGLK